VAKLLFIDSFDHYSTAQTSRKWTVQNGATITSAGRTGNGMIGAALDFPSKTLDQDYTTLTMGAAYNTQSFANAILYFRNVINDVQFSLFHVGDGRLRFRFQALPGSPISALSAPSSYVINNNRWYYFEMQATLDGGPPAHVVASARVNGVEFLTWDYTHASLGAAGMAFRYVTMEAPGGGLKATYDDLYVTDTEFLGDVRIGVLYPNAVGDSSAWTPNSAGANYTKVMEHPADDNVTYVAAASTGLKDLYNLDDIDPAFVGTIKGVQALWCVVKSDEGDAAVKGLWKSSGTEIVQASGHNFLPPNGYYPSATSYLYNIQTERKSLFTAADWTKTEINALQLGITRTV